MKKVRNVLITLVVLALVFGKFIFPMTTEKIQNVFEPIANEIHECAPAVKAIGESISEKSDAVIAWWTNAEN